MVVYISSSPQSLSGPWLSLVLHISLPRLRPFPIQLISDVFKDGHQVGSLERRQCVRSNITTSSVALLSPHYKSFEKFRRLFDMFVVAAFVGGV